MGNHKFRLSNMIPNSWFYKLREMKRGSNKSQRNSQNPNKRSNSKAPTSSATPKPSPPLNTSSYLPNRASYYFPSRERSEKFPKSPTQNSHKALDTHFPADPPRRSKKLSPRRPSRAAAKMASSVSTSASKPEPAPESRPFDRDVYTEEDDGRNKTILAESLESEGFSVTASATDIIIDIGEQSSVGATPGMRLPRILTKPIKREEADKPTSDSKRRSPSRKSPAGMHRIRVRPGSPRLARSKAEAKVALQQRKGLMESFVVVKSTLDPQTDFKESMVEMIAENNIRSSKDLEELLACYLALNSREYHAVIVKVFEQIWLDLNDITL